MTSRVGSLEGRKEGRKEFRWIFRVASAPPSNHQLIFITRPITFHLRPCSLIGLELVLRSSLLVTLVLLDRDEVQVVPLAGIMSFIMDASKSLLVVPRDYTGVRPHHVVVLYAAARFVTSTKLFKKASNSILSLLSQTTEVMIPLIYAGVIPDFLIRFGIRIQLYDHLALLRNESAEAEHKSKMEIVKELHNMPIAIETDAANAQHYEVPAKFYDLCLGPCKKYSSGLWPKPDTTFEESEILMLDLYCERAGVKDGMHIVDLGK